MKFHPELGPTPTVGVEIEVARWKNGTELNSTAKKLEDAGLMPPNSFSQGRHDYHCDCALCRAIGTEVSFPVLFKCQRDASLPRQGGEFISSPFPLDEVFLNQATQAYEIIGEAAERPTDSTRNQNDNGTAEVGLHVHAYSSGPNMLGMSPAEGLVGVNLTAYAGGAFFGFVPELFAIARANSGKYDRSLLYRHVDVEGFYGQLHHGYIAAASTRRRDGRVDPHVEWRLWEMPYDDVEYYRGVLVISAALTQILHRKPLLDKLRHLNALTSWADPEVRREQNSSLKEKIIDSFSKRRFELLSHLILEGTGVVDEPFLRDQAERILNRVG